MKSLKSIKFPLIFLWKIKNKLWKGILLENSRYVIFLEIYTKKLKICFKELLLKYQKNSYKNKIINVLNYLFP